MFSLWGIRGLHTHIQAIAPKTDHLWTLFADPGRTHPSQHSSSLQKSMPPEMSSWLQLEQSIKLAQPMAPCIQTSLSAPYYWCHYYDDTITYNGPGTPEHQPEILQGLYCLEI